MARVLTSLLRGSAMIRIRPEVSGLLKAGDASAVLTSLQFALELEHATIPPYLYAMWSLGTSSTNSAAARIIRSVVNEEMRHLATVANLINALGGTPVFDSPSVLPHYPGPLPGAVEEGLSVGLAPFSRNLVEEIFMVIEQPEHPLEFQSLAAAADEPMTIGQFYLKIRAVIGDLGGSAFTGPPGNQVTPDTVSGVVAVTDVATAEQAIDTIISQGEGTATSPGEVVGSDFAHYYRFAEIVKGHKLVPNPAAGPSDPPDQRFTYTGAEIHAPTGVIAAPVNPTTAGYPEGSAARQASIDFNFTYTGMLKAFQDVFSGHPDQISDTVDTMTSSLQPKATAMMALTPPAGPTFEWQPASA